MSARRRISDRPHPRRHQCGFCRRHLRDRARLDRKKTYIVHCAAGGRSTQSLAVFARLGFTSVQHLDGGLNGWIAAGKTGREVERQPLAQRSGLTSGPGTKREVPGGAWGPSLVLR